MGGMKKVICMKLQDCINKVNDILRMGVPIKVECKSF